MAIDTASVDEVLATTRAVRKRLDLDRPVDLQVVLDCIELAEQAPTGGNSTSRRWIVVQDPRVKDQLGQLYQDSALEFMTKAVERMTADGDPNLKVMSSAAYLAEHLAEVPLIVIPTIIGRHDGSGRPGLFDSVIQAAWSFCLALRARGLGTTWVTAALQDRERVHEVLGIPDDVTEIALFPVAWTKGTDFGRAQRPPARQITFFDQYGRTADTGPSNPIRFDDGLGLLAEADIDASPKRVWELVTDLDLPARFSSEFIGADWSTDERGLGAMFEGRNRHEALGEWSIPCYVDAYDEERTFGWRTSHPENPGARWRFDLLPHGRGTRLRFSYGLGPGFSGTTMAIERHPGKEDRVIGRRFSEVQANMRRTVAGIKDLAEAEEPSRCPR